jgi:hypothetical protein
VNDRQEAKRSIMKIFGFNLGLFGENNPKRMPVHLFFRARRIDYKTALRADISKQNYTVCPRHWYVDALFVCRECSEEFVFSATEQRFWYEDRQFFVDSLPTRCVGCRKAERNRLELRRRYDAMISDALGTCPPEKKKAVIELVDELEAAEGELPDRMKQNRATLRAQLRTLSK